MQERLGTIEISGRAAAILSAVSIPIAVLTLVGAVAVAATLHPDLGSTSVVEIGVPLLVALLGTLFVHEGIHAAAFLALGGHPRFGTMRKGGFPFLYVSCPGRIFPPIQFVAVGLTPLILLDVVALGLLTDVRTVGVAIGVLCVNTAGSMGDAWLSGIVLSRGTSAQWEARDGQFVLWGPPTARPS